MRITMNKNYILAMSMIATSIGIRASERGRLTVAQRVRNLEQENIQCMKELVLLKSWICQAQKEERSPLSRKEIAQELQVQRPFVKLPLYDNLPSNRPPIPLDDMESRLKKSCAERKEVREMLIRFLHKIMNPAPPIREEDQWSLAGQWGDDVIVREDNFDNSSNKPQLQRGFSRLLSAVRKWLFS
jgi:hypothetical protein